MQRLPSEIHSYISSIQGVKDYRKQMVLITEEGIYAYIPVCASSEIYSYLEKIHFSSFYPLLNSYQDSFQIFQISDYPSDDGLLLLEDYYRKSSQTKLFDSEQVSSIYQKCRNQLHSQYQFYFDMQNRIEEMYYPRKPFYFLLLHMSDIYHLLSLGEFFLNEWYELHPTEYKETLTLRKIDDYNFWNHKIIDVSFSRRDYYIYELANYYQMYYENDSLLEDFDAFFHQFPVTQEDLLLFYVLISSVGTFDLETFESEERILSYVSKTYHFLSEKYKEYQENKEKMFKEK